jgi:hypothetical protein
MQNLFPERWSFRQFNEFFKAMVAGQLLEAYKLLEFVMNEDEFKALNAETGASALSSLMQRLSSDAKSVSVAPLSPNDVAIPAPIDAVKVDLSKWSIPQIYQFELANKSGDVEEVERLLHLVAHLDGVDKSKPLPYWEGLLIKSAVVAKHSRLLSGKN